MRKNIFCNVLLPLFIGCLIYWAARPSIWAFRGQIKPLIEIQYVPNWIVYNLPDGLWSYSLMFFTLILWQNSTSLYAKFWLAVAFLLGIFLEIGQYFHLIAGTFDWLDIATYFVFNLFSIRQFKSKTT